jgi:phosphoribosylformylglycinamidine (FGAM) synthase PurS component
MVNENKEDFMMAGVNAAKEWRVRAYEACVETFTKKCVTEAMTVKMPKDADFDEQDRIKKNAAHEIAQITSKLINNAIVDETNELYNVELAHDIKDPDDIGKNIQKLLADHIYDEAKDRCKTLSARYMPSPLCCSLFCQR